MLHCKLLRSPLPHARIVRIDTSRAPRASRRAPRADRRGLPDPVRHPAGEPGRARARAATRVRFVGDPVAAVIARDELTAAEALDLIDVEYEPLRTFADARGQPRASRAAHPRLRRRRQHPQARVAASSATSTRRSPTPTTSSTTSSSSRATRTCRSSSTPRSRRRIRDGKLVALVEHADAALPAPRARQGARRCRRRTSASSPRPTAAASAARAIRSTTRSSSPRRR